MNVLLSENASKRLIVSHILTLSTVFARVILFCSTFRKEGMG